MKLLISDDQLREALGIPFSDEQLAAIKAPLAPQIIIAGAGTGKTTVMAARIVWLVANKLVEPNAILGLSFTRKAAGELRARAFEALTQMGISPTTGIPDIQTYDSFAQRICRDFSVLAGIDNDFRLISRITALEISSEVIDNSAEYLIPFQENNVSKSTLVSGLLELYNQMQNHLTNPEQIAEVARDIETELSGITKSGEFLTPAKLRSAWIPLLKRLQQTLLERNSYQFSDFTALAARLVAEYPAIGESLRQQYRLVLVDEYQDTSMAQAQLLKHLFSNGCTGFPITAVGDPHQAIYTWRGASSNNISQFKTDFPNADGSPIYSSTLSTNRRSQQVILELANAVSSSLSKTGTGVALQSGLSAKPTKTEIHRYLNWESEIAGVVAEIRRLHDGEEALQWKDIAVLVATKTKGKEIYQELIAQDIPAQLFGLSGLLAVPEIADIVATIRLAVIPHDNQAAMRLLLGARWNLDKSDVLELYRVAKLLNREQHTEDESKSGPGRSKTTPEPHVSELRTPAEELSELETELANTKVQTQYESLLLAARTGNLRNIRAAAKKKIKAWAEEIIELSKHSYENPMVFVRRVIKTIGIQTELEIRRTNFASVRLDAFTDVVTDYCNSVNNATVSDLVNYLELAEEHESGLEIVEPTELDAVQIMSCHKAKGLEWQAVFMPHLRSDYFPKPRLMGGENYLKTSYTLPARLRGDYQDFPDIALTENTKAGELTQYGKLIKAYVDQESRRLAYVTITRARQYIYLSTHLNEGKPSSSNSASCYLLEAESALAKLENDRPVRFDYDDEEFFAARDNDEDLDEFHITWLENQEKIAKQPESEYLVSAQTSAEIDASAQLVLNPPNLEFTFDEKEKLTDWQELADQAVQQLRDNYESENIVTLPQYLSTTALAKLHDDPDDFGLNLKRPMPQVSHPLSKLGTKFHNWVALKYSDIARPDIEPVDIDGDKELQKLVSCFLSSEFADRTPIAVEYNFDITIDGLPIRGSIDAVYQESDGTYLIVDWKTGDIRNTHTDQLNIYALAWSKLNNIPLGQISVAFYDVRAKKLIRHEVSDSSHLLDVILNEGKTE